ncbi:MAG TPA: amidohydrolase family protein [Bryobacteraceae bacterium]|nr:amidohydrolase family protein [Bryobacteraceae bacterium]
MLIQNGFVLEAGASRRVENLKLARNAVDISAAGSVVMPGFVDSHTHLLYPPPGARFAPNLEAISGVRLEMQARLHLEAMARHGTTTVEVKTGSGNESSERKLLRVLSRLRGRPLEVVSTLDLSLPDSPVEARAWVDSASTEFLHKVRRSGLAAFVDIDCVDGAAAFNAQRRYLEAARASGLGLKVHAGEKFAFGAVELALEYGAVSVDHLEGAGPLEISLLAKSRTTATVLPAWSLHNNRRYAPARGLVDAGCAIALATNFNPRHTPTLSMQMVIMLACSQMRLTPAEAIAAATINGAHALGRAAEIGSLECGKSADVLVLNISDYRELGRQCGANLVRLAMRRGQLIYEEGEVGPRPVSSLAYS